VTPASGRQVEVAHGEQHATIVEVGGGLRAYRVGDRDVIDGYRVDSMCSGARGQVLMPWPNRIRDGAYELDGTRHQLALSEPAARNAIHGLVRWATWTVAHHGPDRVVMAHHLHPQPGYPFMLDLEVGYALDADGLSVRMRATNVGAVRAPFGAGMHPYLAAGGDPIDTSSLRVPASTALLADDRGIPLSRSSVDGTELDFRSGRSIGSTFLDHAMTDLDRDAQGKAWVELSAPDGVATRLWVDRAFRYLMLFSGDTLPVGRRRSLAVEPMTCAPNAFVSGDGLLILEPGEAFEGSWGIAA
jgi:aldose 1-epimerase